MKLHFSIAAAEELRERRGGRYVLCSVCLEGFLLGRARYSQLRRWDAQLRQLFGSAVPAFPPKFYLVMTKSMAEERWSQLEQYLQNVSLDSNIIKSDVFISFFQKLQQALLVKSDDLDTFKIQTRRAFLDVYLANGSNIRLDIQTSDTAERILEGATKYGEEDTLELRLEYNDSGTWQWIILYTKQAFLLSSCLKKMISEQVMKAAKEGQETEIKMPESTKNSKKSSIQQKQVAHSDFISRERFLVRPNDNNCVFEEIKEEDL